MLNKIKTNQFYINYRRMLLYVKPYWFRAVLAMLLCIPIGSLDALIALSLKPYMDAVIVGKTMQSPWFIPFAIVAFTCLQGGLIYISSYLNTWVGGQTTKDLREELYRKLLSFETSYFDKRKSGHILTRFNSDASQASSGLLSNLRTVATRLCSAIALTAVMVYNSWQLALIALAAFGIAGMQIRKIRKHIEEITRENLEVSAEIVTSYNESFAGNKTITSFNLADQQQEKFSDTLKTSLGLSLRMVKKTGWLSPTMRIIVSIGIAIIIGYGSHLVLTEQITSGNFISFIAALLMLYTPFKNLGAQFASTQRAFLAMERVFGIMDTEPAIMDKRNAVELKEIRKGIELRNVSFAYLVDKPVLQNINLTVRKNETIALVGHSGGGKTTLVNLLPRFYDVASGSINIDGVDIRDYTLKSLRDQIAVVFQDNFLFSGTIRENIVLGRPHASEADISEALKMAYLDEFVAELPDGVDTYIGERGILLSGGQKQRVAIARAFIKDAPIIILDEATSSLDNNSEAIVQKAIDNLMQDKTVFVIAHRLSTIHNADRIAVINEGQLAELGTHTELLAIPGGRYRHLYDMQFRKLKEAA